MFPSFEPEHVAPTDSTQCSKYRWQSLAHAPHILNPLLTSTVTFRGLSNIGILHYFMPVFGPRSFIQTSAWTLGLSRCWPPPHQLLLTCSLLTCFMYRHALRIKFTGKNKHGQVFPFGDTHVGLVTHFFSTCCKLHTIFQLLASRLVGSVTCGLVADVYTTKQSLVG